MTVVEETCPVCEGKLPMWPNGTGYYCFCVTCHKDGTGDTVEDTMKSFINSIPGKNWSTPKSE